MKSRALLLACLVFALFGIKNAHAGDTIPLSQVPPDILQALEAAKTRLAACYKKYGYDVSFLNHPYIASWESSPDYQEEIYWFGNYDYYDFEVLPTGQVIEFTHRGAKKGIYNQPEKPTWPQEKVTKMGQDFLEALLGSPLKNVDVPQVDYYKSSQLYAKSPQGNTQYGPGYWSVIWERIDEKTKIPFAGNHLSCAIIEGEGMSNVGFTLTSNFSSVDFTPVKAEDALPEAIDASKKMAQWKPLNGMFDGGSLDEKPYRSCLNIVQPNHWGTPEVTSIYAKPDLNARLVWEFWFAWYPDGQPHDPKKNTRGLAVFIDAKTKEWVGGDAGSQ